MVKPWTELGLDLGPDRILGAVFAEE